MSNNLLPPFILREAGVRLCDTPKIQMGNPTVDHHSIYFLKISFRIPLLLWGILSYFQLIKLTATNMKETEEIYILTPILCNPRYDEYSGN